MKVIPSILTSPAEDGIRQIRRLLPYYKRYSIDIADGKYVTNATASAEDYSKALKSLNADEMKELILDFDLMVEDYKKNVALLQILAREITIGTVFVHYSSLQGDTFPVNNDLTIGISIDYQDQVSEVDSKYNLKTITNIQVMTIELGRQGNPFMPELLPKIEQVKSLNYESLIFIDGAVNLTTLPALLSLPHIPDYVCPGSYFSKADNIAEQVNKMEEFIKNR